MTIHHEAKDKIIDIPLNEINYPIYPNGNYRYARIIRTGVDFPNIETNIDPYLLGLWLGDGTKEKAQWNKEWKQAIHEAVDPEVTRQFFADLENKQRFQKYLQEMCEDCDPISMPLCNKCG